MPVSPVDLIDFKHNIFRIISISSITPLCILIYLGVFSLIICKQTLTRCGYCKVKGIILATRLEARPIEIFHACKSIDAFVRVLKTKPS